MPLSTPPKVPKKTGAFILTLGGVTATFTAATAREWLELISQYGPLVLSTWLMYVVYIIDKQRTELRTEVADLRVKIIKLEKDMVIESNKHSRRVDTDNGS